MTRKSSKFMLAATAAAVTLLVFGSAAAGDSSRNTSSLLPMFLADNASTERRLARRLLAGEDPASPAMREEAHNLRLLQTDILVLGYSGDLPAVDASSAKEIAVRVLIHHAGLGAVDPWSILAGRTLVFQRGRE